MRADLIQLHTLCAVFLRFQNSFLLFWWRSLKWHKDTIFSNTAQAVLYPVLKKSFLRAILLLPVIVCANKDLYAPFLFVLLLAASTLLISGCKRLFYNARVIEYDYRKCACCGGLVVEVDGHTYQAFVYPENLSPDMRDQFPYEVNIEYNQRIPEMVVALPKAW